jgi:RNA polymerase sigma-70 factor (ECF subfamily)
VSRLVEAYLGRQRRDGAPPESQVPPAALEASLLAIFERGRAAHPALVVDDAELGAHLARCGAPVSAASIHAEDLYLACACIARVPGALERLQAAQRPAVAHYLRRLGRAQGFLDEVEQRLWDALIVGTDSGPRLATYAGVGPLEKWIGVSAQRTALMLLRHEDAEERARGEAAAQARLVQDDPELAAIRDRYREPFQRALEAAVDVLDSREKALYRMHLVEGLTMERIAKAYGVHHATVSRWLDAARARVLAEVKRRLGDELHLAPSEFDSLVRLLVSQLDLDISRALDREE